MSCRRDHPRVCGEKPSASLITSVVAGSPPRMRGKVPSRRSTETKPGITPAYAGKSACVPTRRVTILDHPRVCGEKSSVLPSLSPGTGSPPRMRGKGRYIRGHKRPQGITPAYAGKSFFGYLVGTFSKDHPRVCGEKQAGLRAVRREPGSPPRMRGKD